MSRGGHRRGFGEGDLGEEPHNQGRGRGGGGGGRSVHPRLLRLSSAPFAASHRQPPNFHPLGWGAGSSGQSLASGPSDNNVTKAPGGTSTPNAGAGNKDGRLGKRRPFNGDDSHAKVDTVDPGLKFPLGLQKVGPKVLEPGELPDSAESSESTPSPNTRNSGNKSAAASGASGASGGGSRPITVESISESSFHTYSPRSSVELSQEMSSQPLSQATLSSQESHSSSVKLEDAFLECQREIERLSKELAATTQKNKEKDGIIHQLKQTALTTDDKDAKIKALRGRKTNMENEIEDLKKQVSQVEKLTKESDEKLQSAEAELKRKQDELDKLNKAAIDELEHQLAYAKFYQDKLNEEVEKQKAGFENEVLRLQDYYDSRVEYFRHTALVSGKHMGPPVVNRFPEPYSPPQRNQVGRRGQGGSARGSQQQQRPGMLAGGVAPPRMTFPQGLPRARVPMFMNPMVGRIQEGMGVEPQNGSQRQNNATTTTAPNNQNSRNGNPGTRGRYSAFRR